jgi:hypothetical protein
VYRYSSKELDDMERNISEACRQFKQVLVKSEKHYEQQALNEESVAESLNESLKLHSPSDLSNQPANKL